jgi:hypothetical protein
MLRRDTIIIGSGATNLGVETSVYEELNCDLASIVVRQCCWSGDPAAHAKMCAQLNSGARPKSARFAADRCLIISPGLPPDWNGLAVDRDRAARGVTTTQKMERSRTSRHRVGLHGGRVWTPVIGPSRRPGLDSCAGHTRPMGLD